ncbi:uncharacterized protein BDZ99DRAFT_478398 [Mytilinidion resinicola]|uniref:Uncharacterized protein n=1 Tax=Mytilinidion resinicola TaxID=574789 RepID=A0A6A6YIU1_9PEZI|nr:uncharacterized protein BDZ99DRAFT_478398 [Mytilinidion resinicola]KAF2807875.1 hypothetical protein BDZ99DRAFT_478398 [Mytilinidion resinicola]
MGAVDSGAECGVGCGGDLVRSSASSALENGGDTQRGTGGGCQQQNSTPARWHWSRTAGAAAPSEFDASREWPRAQGSAGLQSHAYAARVGAGDTQPTTLPSLSKPQPRSRRRRSPAAGTMSAAEASATWGPPAPADHGVQPIAESQKAQAALREPPAPSPPQSLHSPPLVAQRARSQIVRLRAISQEPPQPFVNRHPPRLVPRLALKACQRSASRVLIRGIPACRPMTAAMRELLRVCRCQPDVSLQRPNPRLGHWTPPPGSKVAPMSGHPGVVPQIARILIRPECALARRHHMAGWRQSLPGNRGAAG